MTIKYLYIFLFLFVAQLGSTQQAFTEQELQDFVNVYMSFKGEKKRSGVIDKKHFDINKVSPERYREISSAALDNRPIILSSNEEKLMADLQNQDRIVNETNEKTLNEICTAYSLSKHQYAAILNMYNTDIQFQRSLKPHFQAYIKRMK